LNRIDFEVKYFDNQAIMLNGVVGNPGVEARVFILEARIANLRYRG